MLAALLTIALGYATGMAEMQLTLIAVGVALVGLSRLMRAYTRLGTRETRSAHDIAQDEG